MSNDHCNVHTGHIPSEISPSDILKESQVIAKRAEIRWELSQTGGMPVPTEILKNSFKYRFSRLLRLGCLIFEKS